ncbi:MAG: hypothetical protein J5I94_05395 [Phaeodactylibacter sp.]|nr:hypothetical protein [Phaeodactylibacter sp.]
MKIQNFQTPEGTVLFSNYFFGSARLNSGIIKKERLETNPAGIMMHFLKAILVALEMKS